MRHLRLCSIILLVCCCAGFAQQQRPTHPRIANIVASSDDIAVLQLRPGYVTSVFLPEDVRSIVLGDPSNFRAEHSENEPRLVTVKPVTPKPAETNLLVTTTSGREVSLHLVSDGRTNSGGNVDFVLLYEDPGSAWVSDSRSTLFIPDTKELLTEKDETSGVVNPVERELIYQTSVPAPTFVGRGLKVAIGRLTDMGDAMIVGFSVLNASSRSVELLVPQIQLAGPQQKQHQSIKAEPVPLREYRLTARHLAPGMRADGVAVFERPSFKESSEHLLLEVAQADAVDRPVLVPLMFTAPVEGGKK